MEMSMSSGAEESTLKGSYYRLMLYAGLFGGLFSLVTAGYITLYNQGIKFFGQHSVYLYNINFWPLILLGVAGVFIGLAIKFFGQHGGLGVAQTQYAKTGGVNYRNLPSILLQGFIALWSGAAIGPEGTLAFLTGGLGTFCLRTTEASERRCASTSLQRNSRGIWWFLWLSDSWSSWCSRVHVHQGAKFVSSSHSWSHSRSCGLWCLLCHPAYVISRCIQLS